jgi:hypothetical protein
MADLTIAEQIVLLAYGPDGRQRTRRREIDLAVAGALLAQLVADGGADVVDGRLTVAGRSTPAGAELDRAARAIADKDGAHAPRWWVRRLASAGSRQRLLDRLVAAGVLEKVTKRILGLFPVDRYPQRGATARDAAVGRLRAVAAGSGTDPRDKALAALAHAARLDRDVVDKPGRSRLAALVADDWDPPALFAVASAGADAVVANRRAAQSASSG